MPASRRHWLRRGWAARRCLLTINADTIGQMSCNPAIGGLAKGHLAREIDALGGEMGKATDMTGLQFRMLNTKKGPAVWAPRAQCDKKAYQFRLKWICEREPNLDVKQGQTSKILHKDGQVFGVETTLEVQYHGDNRRRHDGNILAGPDAHRPEPAIRRTGRGIRGHGLVRFAQGDWLGTWPAQDRHPAPAAAPIH